MTDYEVGHNDGIQDRLNGSLPCNWETHVDDYLFDGERVDIDEYKRGYNDGWNGLDALDIPSDDNDGLVVTEDDMRAELRDMDLAELGC